MLLRHINFEADVQFATDPNLKALRLFVRWPRLKTLSTFEVVIAGKPPVHALIPHLLL